MQNNPNFSLFPALSQAASVGHYNDYVGSESSSTKPYTENSYGGLCEFIPTGKPSFSSPCYGTLSPATESSALLVPQPLNTPVPSHYDTYHPAPLLCPEIRPVSAQFLSAPVPRQEVSPGSTFHGLSSPTESSASASPTTPASLSFDSVFDSLTTTTTPGGSPFLQLPSCTFEKKLLDFPSVYQPDFNTMATTVGSKTKKEKKRRKLRKYCELCDRSYSSNASLRHHIDAVHEGNTEKLRCQICGKIFSIPSSLTRHMHIHRNEKRHECATCHRRFTDLSTYYKHLVIHTGERPYQCDVCNKTFTQSGNLLRHKRNFHAKVPNGKQESNNLL